MVHLLTGMKNNNILTHLIDNEGFTVSYTSIWKFLELSYWHFKILFELIKPEIL